MSDNENEGTGTLLLPQEKFVTWLDANGDELPPVPKHWGADDMPAGATKVKAAKADKSDKGGVDPNDEPSKSGTKAAWVAYAKAAKGASDQDLVDVDGKDLTRDALAAKFGTPAE